ncbi:MAG: tetratricopeptide repeat protein [Thermoguttaceae bacterium]
MIRISSLLSVFVLLSAVVAAEAADPGQPDLDKAMETKLNATTISDLSEAIRLADSALQKGLDAGNKDFAEKLLASTLLQRAQETVKRLLGGAGSPSEFRRNRQFALADLERVAKLDPKQGETHLLIAQLWLLPGGDVRQARQSLDRAVQSRFDKSDSEAKAYLLRSGLQESPEKKLADLNEAVRRTPDNANMLRARAVLLHEMKKTDQALADLDRAIELEPDELSAYGAKAVVLSRQKRYAEALDVLEKAQKRQPDSLMPLVQRARVRLLQNDLPAALQELSQALAMDPDNIGLLLMRASVYQEKGETAKAMIDVNRALKQRPHLSEGLRMRAMLYGADKRYEEAIADVRTILEKEPKDSVVRLQLAMLYGAAKQTAKAIETYTELLADEPKQWQALRGRGDMLLNLGRQSDALADYEKALKIKPDDYGLLNNLAWVLATSPDAKLRDGRRALELATKACKQSDYKLAYILSTLAAAYAETGDFQNAVKWSTKAVKIGDKDHDESLQKELKSYQDKKPWRELLSEEKADEKKPVKPAAKEKAGDAGPAKPDAKEKAAPSKPVLEL